MTKAESIMKDLKETKSIKEEDAKYLYDLLNRFYGEMRKDDCDGVKGLAYPFNLIRAITGDYACAYPGSMEKEFKERIEWVLDNMMEEKYAKVIRYSFRDYMSVYKISELPEYADCSAERIRQRLAKALRILRHPTRYHVILTNKTIVDYAMEVKNKYETMSKEYNTKLYEFKHEIKTLATALDMDVDDNSLEDTRDLSTFDLSIRSYNCCKRAGINTIGDLRKKTSEEAANIRNLGRKGFSELSCLLAANNYTWRV